MILKILGGILFLIGVVFLLPFEDVFLLLPLVAYFGIGVIPIYYAIGLGCFILGCLIIGIHIIPWMFKHPLGIITLIIVFIITIVYVLGKVL